MEERNWENPNWVEYNLYLLPLRKLVCLLRGHSWFYTRKEAMDGFSRVCKRCSRAESCFVVENGAR